MANNNDAWGGARPGAGRPRVRLRKAEQAAMLELARSHGYSDAGLLYLAIISGEIATVLMDDDDRWYAIERLDASDDDILISIGRQLRAAAEREQRQD